jgi:type II secretory pathway pseudopilin PulG
MKLMCRSSGLIVRQHFQKAGLRERGYVLLVLLVMVMLLSIGLLAMVQNLASQVKRDREEELIHRGAQYSRAVRLFVRKFHRYPASVEELESTNQLRFLRKRYKDPVTGKDFKPLYMTEVAAFHSVAPPASPSTQAPEAPAVQSQQDDPNGPNGKQVISRESDGGVYTADTPIAKAEKPDSAPAGSTGSDVPATKPDAEDDETPGAPPLHGVPIVGVVSLSKERSIREFDKKDHYDQWLFIFNPSTSPTSGTLGLISTPDQPSLLSKAQIMGLQNENSKQDMGANLQPNSSVAPSADRQ